MAIKNRLNIIFHGVIWALFFCLNVYLLNDFLDFNVALFRSSFVLTISMGVFYFNSEFLIPKLLKAKRYYIYVLSILALFFLVILLYHLADIYLFDDEHARHFRPRGPKHERWGRGHRFHGKGPSFLARIRTLMTMFITIVVLFISTAYKLGRMASQRAREAAELKSVQLETEMKFLRSQINPHFLFNALNNVYSLAVMKSDKAPEVVLKLSDLLRYLLYECNEPRVLLEKELKYINDFIELQQVKTEERQKISFNMRNDHADAEVAPMLFIPFIENSFKHSKIEDVETGWVKIDLTNTSEKLMFKISNSVPDKEYTKDKQSGIGLDNVKRRLELLYPDHYTLQIDKNDEGFFVTLIIEKKQ